MENKICPVCQAPNEEAYLFCKHCGTSLRDALPAQQANIPPEMQAPPPYYAPPGAPDGGYTGYPPYGAQAGYAPEELIDGIPVSLAAAYLGPKNSVYVGKFLMMERTRSKVSFNGPVFALGFLLSPLGGAIWFLQKKLYLLGLLLMTVGILIMGINIAAAYGMVEAIAEHMPDTYITDSDELQSQLEESLIDDEAYLASVSSAFGVTLVTGFFSLALSIVTALFANFWYKTKMVSVIRTLSGGTGYADPNYLAARGGNSALWVVALILLILGSFVGSSVAMAPLLSAISAMGGATIALPQVWL